ncbi:MAG: Ig-like domain-containing protein, partial [Hyphomicrobium sp.]
MLRLAFAFILLLLMLFGGTIWLLDMGPPSLAPEPPGEKQRAAKPDSPKSDADQLQEALNPPAAASGLGFDIARIDPDGTSVFAGRGEPRSLVTITVDGQEIGTAQVDENGEWTLTTDTKIANPDGKLALFKAPAGAVARIVGAEPRQPAMKAATTTTPAKPNTAGAVASNMLKSLEDMVATARSDAASEAPAAAAVPPAAPEVPDPSATAMPAPTRHS